MILNLREDEKKGFVLRNTTQISDDSMGKEEVKNVCFSRNNLAFPDIKISFEDSWNVDVVNTNFKEFHLKFLHSQLEKLDDLISNSHIGFLEFAHSRKVQILTILYYNSVDKEETKNKILTEYNLLQSNSKRMKRMYDDFKKKFQ